MRLNCSLYLPVALLLAACSANNGTDPAMRKEFSALENDLNLLSNAPESDWIDHLERIKATRITDPSVEHLRGLCTSAYEAFAEATVRLAEARQKVALAEQNAQDPEGRNGQEIRNNHIEAVRSTEEVSAALDTAEGLVRACMDERRALRDRLAGHGSQVRE